MMTKYIFLIMSILIISSCAKTDVKDMNTRVVPQDEQGLETATFAGGCFWCVETAFEDLDGVKKVVSGYSGGHVKNPSYEEVCTGTTGHLESVQIVYDPQLISYSELVDIFWKQIDPTDGGGSFVDRGSQYLSAIFYHNECSKKDSRIIKGRTG